MVHALRPDPDVVSQRMADGMVLVQLRTNRIFSLNGTAARFWELLEEGCDTREAKRRLLVEYAVTEERLSDEVESLVATLTDASLVAS